MNLNQVTANLATPDNFNSQTKNQSTNDQNDSRPYQKEEENKISKELQSRYRTGVGMLLYLIKHSRPELLNPVHELLKCLSGPTEAAWKEMLRVIKYVLSTPGKGLHVEPLKMKEWLIVVFTDSDWAGNKDTQKLVSGF